MLPNEKTLKVDVFNFAMVNLIWSSKLLQMLTNYLPRL